jgi:MbtH protein
VRLIANRKTDLTVDPREGDDTMTYKVIVNDTEQYSIWPAHRENALGWRDAGKNGTKEECVAYIKQIWDAMQPPSLRKKLEDDKREG